MWLWTPALALSSWQTVTATVGSCSFHQAASSSPSGEKVLTPTPALWPEFWVSRTKHQKWVWFSSYKICNKRLVFVNLKTYPAVASDFEGLSKRCVCGFSLFVESSGSTPKPGQFSVPHSLALVPHLDQLCVADRENGRIQCFRTDTKEFVREIKHASFGRNVFAISYIPGISLLFALLYCLPLTVVFTQCAF